MEARSDNERAGAGAAAAKGTMRRSRQFTCCRCGNTKMPATGGTRERTEGLYRYRECTQCGHKICTLQKHGEPTESVVC